MLTALPRRVTRSGLLCLLAELEERHGPGTSTYIPPGTSRRQLEDLLGLAVGPASTLEEVVARAGDSSTGAVVLWGDRGRYAVLPPFPVGERVAFSGYELEPLRALVGRDYLVAVVLVRLGLYAIGVLEGEQLLSSKVGGGLVHSRHKKGGSSQGRFARGREKQMERFFDRVCDRARERIEPYMSRVDHAVYGGERNTVLAFRKQCHFLRALDERALDRLFNVREPKQGSLLAAIKHLYASEVIEWVEA